MIYRVFVEKKPIYALEAKELLSEINSFLSIKSIEKIRIFNRYDVENIDKDLFDSCVPTVFSEPQIDNVYFELPDMGDAVFAYEYLPGQFDQRADSAAQCIALISAQDRPAVKTAKVVVLYGNPTKAEIDEIKKYVINPVDSREASLDTYSTLKLHCSIPTEVKILDGFIDLSDKELEDFVSDYSLAMDKDDIKFCQDYFKNEKRNPTISEIRILDTYWSDHCRHTTFLTNITRVQFEDKDIQSEYESYLKLREELNIKKPVTLMDLGTIGAKKLKKEGKLDNLDESDEINACTVVIDVDVNGKTEKWLLLFKNETHNHPTEIEPFGGAATCIGGAIRDPLSSRGYVYQAMRVTGAANPLTSIDKTIAGKLPQRKIVTTAANGYSSYGNQIGLATGLVEEIYHDGYAAKHLEVGMVVGAVPLANVRREEPSEGDLVILLGGRTGRDGCGGATGSSKSHTVKSIENCGAEVQKGNAPEERKLQRLFRNPRATALIKRCNDFGAGGVSVAIGELAEGLVIDLNAVPKKYDGLDGTELAISESQERMAVVVERHKANEFIELAAAENLEATVVARVTKEPRMVMMWYGKKIADISRQFLNSNGAPKTRQALVSERRDFSKKITGSFGENIALLITDLNICSKRGLSERFDSTIGAGTVLMPYGGKYQRTPIQAMVAKIPVLNAETKTCSVAAYGYNPLISSVSPYDGAYLATLESAAKLVATGADIHTCRLSFQEYFERLGNDPARWGKPLSALLGALKAQLDLGLASIGGKDSMSGTFEDIDVPPTLISFAVGTGNTDTIISPEFKKIGSKIALIMPEYDGKLPKKESVLTCFETLFNLIKDKKVISAYTPTYGGIAEGIFKMTLGNKIGFKFNKGISLQSIFDYSYGGFIVELAEDCANVGINLGVTTKEYLLSYNDEIIDIEELFTEYEQKLEKVYPTKVKASDSKAPQISYAATSRVAPKIGIAKPKVLIPVFPGTNCEYDTAKAFAFAGAQPVIEVITNLTSTDIEESAERFAQQLKNSQILFIPGGFSGGDEPDGSGKFITAFLRNRKIADNVQQLLDKDGLIGGICNGFQALIKLGLVPYGKIVEPAETAPTLTFNTIRRHQSRLVRTVVASNNSPWLSDCDVGDIHLTPISHGEGRFICDETLLQQLILNGQIATQYCDFDGTPSMDIDFNPNGSYFAVEGITSPDGRVFGKMAHSERMGDNLYKNVAGNKKSNMFISAVSYFNI